MPWNMVGHLAGPAGATGPAGPTRGVAVFTGTDPPDQPQTGDLWIHPGAIEIHDGAGWTPLTVLAPYTWSDLFEGGDSG